jgi:hypothetical protein
MPKPTLTTIEFFRCIMQNKMHNAKLQIPLYIITSQKKCFKPNVRRLKYSKTDAISEMSMPCDSRSSLWP